MDYVSPSLFSIPKFGTLIFSNGMVCKILSELNKIWVRLWHIFWFKFPNCGVGTYGYFPDPRNMCGKGLRKRVLTRKAEKNLVGTKIQNLSQPSLGIWKKVRQLNYEPRTLKTFWTLNKTLKTLKSWLSIGRCTRAFEALVQDSGKLQPPSSICWIIPWIASEVVYNPIFYRYWG